EGGVLRVGPYPIASVTQRTRGPVVLGLRPEDFVVDGGDGSLPARVELTEHLGPEVLVHFVVDGMKLAAGSADSPGRLCARADPAFHAAHGDEIVLRVRPDRVHLFDPVDGRALF